MALRNIVKEGDPILRKKCREVTEVNDHIRMILDDMLETMYESEGVGIAAPQVGILRRMFIVDIGDGPIELINPEIVEQSGLQEDEEACLSVPGVAGVVKRPTYVKIKGLNRFGEEVEYEGRDFKAKAFCHEYDHLGGILFIDKATSTRTMDMDLDDDFEE
ncbi:MAG: peptide deformylase [Firmicutes bacterium]|nr:peptide deformylase [Bacillota bacterium]